MRPHFLRFAAYNTWANERLYAAVSTLPAEEIARDRQGFFRSILGTLNHIMVADRAWMGRITGSDYGIRALDQILFDDFAELWEARRTFDRVIANVVSSAPLEDELRYRTIGGVDCATPMDVVLTHVFNHQTHHRGQVHHMLGMAGVAPPELDFIYFDRERR
ncbi:DinB family protein [Novispirillum sp. DQ9]|uniref:DinB family protein n=1 Tax=Novispirillum sp. DQ9 TaxID=3398612 RepID=UPI003C79DFC4